MQVQQIYQLALLLLVVPSIPINRIGGVVTLAWVLGELAHLTLPAFSGGVTWEDAANMASYIVAFGAGLALAGEWNTGRNSRGRWAAVLLFVPMIVLAFISANLDPSHSYGDYQIATAIYWPWAALLFAQIGCVLISNDWRKVWDGLCRIDAWIVARVERHFENLT